MRLAASDLAHDRLAWNERLRLSRDLRRHAQAKTEDHENKEESFAHWYFRNRKTEIGSAVCPPIGRCCDCPRLILIPKKRNRSPHGIGKGISVRGADGQHKAFWGLAPGSTAAKVD
jgi:hypothetical protein